MCNNESNSLYGYLWMRCTVGEWKAADRTKAGAHDKLVSYVKAQLEDTEDVVAWWGVSNKYVISIMECC